MEDLRKKKKLEEIRRLQELEEKRMQMEKKRKKEEHWEMARWLHKYIEENNFHWEREKLKRLEERNKILEDWEKNSRLEKIKILKEKFKQRRNPPDVEKFPEESARTKWRRKEVEEEEEFEIREELGEGGDDKKDDYEIKVKINEPKLTKENEIFSTIDDDELVRMVGQDDEGPDLGDNGFCLDCIIQPCA